MTAASSGGMSDEFAYSGTELEAMAHAPNYYRAIRDRFLPHLGQHTVEVGAGVGTFAELLAACPKVEKLTTIEPAENNFPLLEARFRGTPGVVPLRGYLEDFVEELRADAMVLVNVLEHVEKDLDFLMAAYRVLAPGGRILIFVPAMPILFGSLDRAFDHYRRYTRPGLGGVLGDAGFRVRELYYMNLPGAISWFVVGRVLRRRTLSPAQVATYDRFVVPRMVRAERRWHPPLGQSLLAIAEAA